MAGLLSRYFGFRERPTDLATETRAGFTTFMVMAYIIFVNPIILGFTGVPGLDGRGLPFAANLTVTCLAAGLLSIAMGLASNYPFAIATGMGLNAVVAFELVASRGLTWPQAMTVVFLEGLVITVLVLTRFREAVMDAVPIALKRAISVGIGLFIAFIGFFLPGPAVEARAGHARDPRRLRPLLRLHRLLQLGPGGEARRGPAAGRPGDAPRSADRGLRHRILPHGVAHGPPHARRAPARYSRDDRDRDRAQRALRRRPGIRHPRASPPTA